MDEKHIRVADLLALSNFETVSEARKRSRKALKRALKSEKFDQSDLDAWRKCTPAAFCPLACCDLTMRHWREELVPTVINGFIAARKLEGDARRLWAVSIANPKWMFAPGDLLECDLGAVKEELRQILEKAGFGNLRVFGGIDFSLNEHSEKAFDTHWAVHAHFLLDAPRELSGKAISKCLSDQIKKAPEVLRPVHLQLVTDCVGKVLYGFKAIFKRRVSYVAKNGRKATRELPLRDKHDIELRAFLAKLGRKDRLFRNGFRWEKSVLIPTEVMVKETKPAAKRRPIARWTPENDKGFRVPKKIDDAW